MNVLFFLEPSIELENPLFRYATLRNSFLPQIQSLHNAGENIVLVTSSPVAEQALSDRHTQFIPAMAVIDPLEWMDGENYLKRAKRHHLNQYLPNEVNRMESIIRGALPSKYEPDLIIVWESPADYLHKIFSNAKIIYQMPGFFSRPPYANLVSMDVGLLEKSSPVTIDENLFQENELRDLDDFQDKNKYFIHSISPLNYYLKEIRKKFKNIILFPLQLDDYFMISCPLGCWDKQFDALVHILKEMPSDQAILVTNYKSRENNSRVISEKSYSFLKERFPNFFFEKEYDEVPYSSQFLVPFVDGVISVSSSVGYQAAFWKKPFLAIGESHISRFSTASDFASFSQQVYKKKNIDQNKKILTLLKTSHLPMSFISSKSYSLWLRHFVKNGDFAAWSEETLAAELSKESRENDLLSQMKYFQVAKNKSPIERSEELSVQIAKHEIISFDIFDTLLNRPFQRPADLFDFIQNDVQKITNISNLEFKEERQYAEKKAFENARERGEGETSLREIYLALGEKLDLNNAIQEQIMRLEMDTEYALLGKRQSGYEAFIEAKSLGKRVILISDMYMPEDFIIRALKNNGYDGYERIFVSSTYKLKKHSGELFKKILNELSVEPKKILHVGDNIDGDVKRAKENGIKPFHLKKSLDVFCDTSAYILPWSRDEKRHSLDWRMVLAVIGNKFNNNPYLPERKGTLFGGDPWRLGYYGLGPLLLGYTKWLIETAQRDKVEKLYFLSRDGKIMKFAYDKLVPYYETPPASHYLLCSRRAVNLAKVSNEYDLIDLINVDYAHNVTLGHLLTHRFGMQLNDEIKNMLFLHNFNWDSRLTDEDKPRLRTLIVDMKKPLLKIAKEERETYREYLKKCGLTTKAKIAVVDIGYAGTMQESLHTLLNEKSIGGYYLITFRQALNRVVKRGMFAKAFFADFVDRHDTFHPFCRNVPMYETLFSAAETSFLRIARDWNGNLRPIFMEDMPSGEHRSRLVKQLHAGALDFIDDITSRLKFNLVKLDIEPNKTIRVLDCFFQNPHPRDANIFAGIEFEDAYGGRNKIILSPPDDLETPCVWQAGREALIKDKMSKPAGKASSLKNNSATHVQEFNPVNLRFTAKMIHVVLKNTLSERRRNKFLRDPFLFFSDARGYFSKKIGVLYLNGIDKRL